MSTLIFRLRHVPEEEAEAVRNLLTEQQIEWYETTAGNWGIAMPGIWVTHNEQATRARQLIEVYQRELSSTQRELYRQKEQLGENPGLIDHLRKHPVRTLGVFIFCLFILYVSINPFLQMIGYSQQ